MQPHEADNEKARLIFALDTARRRTLEILKDADENRTVHPGSGWRVKDMVAHLLIWEEETLIALQALQKGEKYVIADFGSFDSYNERAIAPRLDTPFEQLKTELHTVREQMKAALLALPPELFSGMMPYPWPWMGSLGNMIEVMVRHEQSHADEIRRAMQEGGPG